MRLPTFQRFAFNWYELKAAFHHLILSFYCQCVDCSCCHTCPSNCLYSLQPGPLADLVFLTTTDNNLLLQLGSVQEGSSKEERDAYIFGLRQMISGMRDKNLKDITAIASEIVAYRSRFLNDSSRVLTNIQDSS